jgi:hypothetical protein
MMVTGVSSAWITRQAVIYDFQDSRSGQHAEAFLKDWQGHLVCDDYSGDYPESHRSRLELDCTV